MNAYGVYFGSRFGWTTSKEKALDAADDLQARGIAHEVRVMRNYRASDYPSFDAPTFRVLSECYCQYEV